MVCLGRGGRRFTSISTWSERGSAAGTTRTFAKRPDFCSFETSSAAGWMPGFDSVARNTPASRRSSETTTPGRNALGERVDEFERRGEAIEFVPRLQSLRGIERERALLGNGREALLCVDERASSEPLDVPLTDRDDAEHERRDASARAGCEHQPAQVEVAPVSPRIEPFDPVGPRLRQSVAGCAVDNRFQPACESASETPSVAMVEDHSAASGIAP